MFRVLCVAICATLLVAGLEDMMWDMGDMTDDLIATMDAAHQQMLSTFMSLKADGSFCEDMASFGDQLTMFDGNILKNVNLTLFNGCLDQFGGKMWDRNQSAGIINMAKREFGPPSGWNKTLILDLGEALKGLTRADIDALAFDKDVLRRFGMLKGLDDEQLFRAFVKAESVLGIGSLDDLSGEDIRDIGMVMCGAPENMFQSMNKDLLMNYTAALGNLSDCSTRKLEILAQKAKEGFGDFRRWSADKIDRLGFIIGGLGNMELGNLTEAQIRAMNAETFKGFKPEKFAAFGETQINALPFDQLRDLPLEMMSQMSPVLMDKLKYMLGMLGEGIKPISGVTDNPLFDFMNPDGDLLKDGAISADQLKMLDPQDFRHMPLADLAIMAANFGQDQIDQVCRMMMEGGDTIMITKLGEIGIDCLNSLTALEGDMSAGAAKALLDQKMATKTADTWDVSDWGTVLGSMADAIDPTIIKDMDSSVMRSMIQQKSFNPEDMQRPDQKRAMSEQIVTAFGSPETWSTSDLADLAEGDFLGSLVDPADLRKMDAADMASSIGSFAAVAFDDKSKKEAVGKKIKEALGGRDNAASWGMDDVKGAAQYIMGDIGILKQLPEATLIESIANFSTHIQKKSDGMGFGKMLREMGDYGVAASMDDSKVAEIAAFLPAMGKSYLKDLPPSTLVNNLGALGAADFSPMDAKELVKDLASQLDFTAIDASTLGQMGSLLGGLGKDELTQMPAASLDDPSVLGNMADMEMSPSKARAIMAKLKANNGGGNNLGPNAKVLGKMIKKVSLSELQGTSLSDFGLACDSADTLSLEPTAAQSKVLVKKMKENYGTISSSNTNYTSSCFSRWGKIAAQGFSKDDIQGLRTDDELKGIVEQLATYEDEMEEAQGKAVCDLIKSGMLATDADFKAMTEATVEQVGKFFKFLSDADLDKFNDTVKPVIARKIGEASMKKVSKSEMQRLKKFAMKNVLRSDTNAVTDRSASATLDDNDIRDMGNLRCGLELADMQKLQTDAVENNVFEMGKMCGFDSDTGKALLDKAAEKISNLLNSADSAVMVAGLLPFADTTQLNNITSAVWEESFASIGEALKERRQKMEERDESFSSERSTTQRDTESSAIGSALKTGIDAYSAAGSGSRRRRSGTSYSCADIQLLGDVTVLTADDITATTTTNFEDCAETLGAESGWDSSQLTALAAEGVAAWGAVNTWTSAEIQSAGSMVAGLTAAEIATMAIDADAMSSIGAYDIFSADQLASGYSAYLTQTGASSSTLTSDDLQSLGAFVCGATESNIGDFSTSSYQDAASTIGDQSMCSSGQLQALATLAKDASVFGASSTWDSSVITSVGSVIGGLSSAEISALTESQISSISATDLALIPAAKFAGFSATQVGYFTSSQASAVTSDQSSALSSDAQDALNNILGISSDNGNGAGFITFSVLLMAISLLFNRL